MSKTWANLVSDLQSQSTLHVLSCPWTTLVCSSRYKILVCRRLTLGYGLPIVFFCFALGYPCATFVCSPRIAHGSLFVDRYLGKQEKVPKNVQEVLISFRICKVSLYCMHYHIAIFVCSPRYKILVCSRLTLGYGLPIVFFCFALGYPWDTFVCSPRVALCNRFVDRYLVKHEENV